MLLASDVVVALILDAVLAFVTWIIIAYVWNNIVREELKAKSYLTWAVLLGIVVAIANAVAIARLLSLQ